MSEITIVREENIIEITSPGPIGEPGQGVPAGGATGQVLAKIDGTDYNTEWVDQSGGGEGGAVDSVNGQTGIVVLDADDIDDFATTNKFVTSSDLTNLNNLSGVNTGDQDLSPYELLSNKVTTLASPNNTDYPTTQLLSDSINSIVPISPVYMLTGINSDISGYESAVALSSFTVGALATIAQTVTTSETLLEEFATNLGFPNSTALPIGIFSAHWETQKAAGSNNYYSFFKLFKRSSGGTETLLLTSDNSSQSALNTIQQVNVSAFNSSIIPLLATDRLVLKIYAQMVSSSASIELRWDDNTDSRFQLAGSPLSYIPEDSANKTTNFTGNTGSNTLFPTVKAIFDALVGYLASYQPLLGFNPANENLSNISGVAVNSSINPDSDLTHDLGQAGINWRRVNAGELMYDDSPTIDLLNRKLIDSSIKDSIDFEARQLLDTSEILSVDYSTRILKDVAAANSIDWTSRQTFDDSGDKSIDYLERQLIGKDGTTVNIDWSENGAPTSVTQSQGDNSTKIATTAYVDTGLATKAALSQVDFISGLIETVSDGDFRLVAEIPYGATITKVTTRSASGTCTATFKINTTALGGAANSVSSTEEQQSHSSANVVAAGDDLVLTVSANASCLKMSFTIQFTRVFA